MPKKGFKFSEESRKKMSLSQKGKKRSESFKQKIRERMKGNQYTKGMKQSREVVLRRAEKMKGHVVTAKTRRKISLANKGKKRSEEVKRRQSEIMKGRKPTENTRRKISLANKGKKRSEETKRKMSLAQVGKKHSAETIEKMKKAGNLFQKGHVPWAKGRVMLKKTRMKISKANKGKLAGINHPFYGKHLSTETKKKISEARKGTKASMATRKKLSKSHKGKILSTETKKKISEARKGRFAGVNSPFYGKQHSLKTRKKISKTHMGMKSTTETKKKISEARAKQKFPRKDTVPEKVLQNLLQSNGIKFDTHVNFNLGFQWHQVDIFIKPNICVEVDGDYMHANPRPYLTPSRTFRKHPGHKANEMLFNRKEVKEIWETDKKQTKALKQLGNKVLRFWHSELETKPEKCIKKIQKTIDSFRDL
ncbi:MAG: NUMOD3 domain-containing DNA-binding protein [Crenarchaeota archaeon]|nr:NUMOD3 domain-containing DNA-binding protein [Thermoproteota archaeon]